MINNFSTYLGLTNVLDIEDKFLINTEDVYNITSELFFSENRNNDLIGFIMNKYIREIE